MATEYDVVDVFVGTFDSQEVLEQYLEETYDQDEEDAPISAFAKDQGEAFYDHDFVESRFDDSAKSFVELGKRHSFSEYWLTRAEESYKAKQIGKVNVILLVFGGEIDEPKSASGDGYQLHYLGRFDEEE